MRELGVSMDTLKKEVGTFMRKKKASGEAEGGEVRSKRVKGGFDTGGGSQKRLAEEARRRGRGVRIPKMRVANRRE